MPKARTQPVVSSNISGKTSPAWHRQVLIASTWHSGLWGLFIMAMPAASAKIYGFAKTPQDIHLWQGTGLFISLLAFGYWLAAQNSIQHWGLVFIGLLAKVFGAIGMTYSAVSGQVSLNVLWLIPVNDVLWWVPFAIIARQGYLKSTLSNDTSC